MKKRETIKKSNEFTKIIKQGKYNKNEYFIIYRYPKQDKIPLFGITVSKKSGNAVVRNKLKRQVKHILDENKLNFREYNDYIILIRANAVNKEFQLLSNNLTNLITKKER